MVGLLLVNQLMSNSTNADPINPQLAATPNELFVIWQKDNQEIIKFILQKYIRYNFSKFQLNKYAII